MYYIENRIPKQTLNYSNRPQAMKEWVWTCGPARDKQDTHIHDDTTTLVARTHARTHAMHTRTNVPLCSFGMHDYDQHPPYPKRLYFHIAAKTFEQALTFKTSTNPTVLRQAQTFEHL